MWHITDPSVEGKSEQRLIYRFADLKKLGIVSNWEPLSAGSPRATSLLAAISAQSKGLASLGNRGLDCIQTLSGRRVTQQQIEPITKTPRRCERRGLGGLLFCNWCLTARLLMRKQ